MASPRASSAIWSFVSAVVSAVALCACEPQIELVSQVLWSGRHEAGDLSEWSADGRGGAAADSPIAAVSATNELAHTGAYSVKLTNGALVEFATARLWREAAYPSEAYYSAWYYIPQPYTARAVWTIMQFKARDSNDQTVLRFLIDLDIRSLPGGELILSVFDHRAPYLRSPTPPTAMVLPIGRWFHVEALFRNLSDDRGRLSVWLDGELNYDIQRPFGTSSAVYWSPCNNSHDLSPADGAIYIDDAAVSLVRITPAGLL